MVRQKNNLRVKMLLTTAAMALVAVPSGAYAQDLVDSGDLINAIDTVANRRNKRLLDLVLGIVFFGLSPIIALTQKKPLGFIKNIFKVLFGIKSWVGYYPIENQIQQLPKIRLGVLNPIDSVKFKNLDTDTIKQLNLLYARDYNLWKDLNIILFAFREMGK